MKKQLIAVTASLLALVATSVVFAGDIYKWTDADGNVHYGDKPMVSDQPERVGIDSAPTDPATVMAMTEARSQARADAAEAAAAAAAEGPSAEELRAEAEDRAQRCAKYRQLNQKFVNSRRLYREDEAGERVYLDEDETLAERQRVADKVSEYCSP
jgi:hypothetical protein